MTTPEDRYGSVVEALRGEQGVTIGASDGRGFGSSALKVNGKIFAMLSSTDAFVVKLPRVRVDALMASGDGVRFDPGHGRLMKEWLAVAPASTHDWTTLAREALAFVAGKR
jgi:hypothetical protein